ncbi:MAG: glycoside hydrolase family 66 protein [Kiritimatiellae bacterium]|nr:glycoside hydrolase family 66 protein [Kiritimatiellia bacterium]
MKMNRDNGNDGSRQNARVTKSVWSAALACLAFVCCASAEVASPPKAMASSPGQMSLSQPNLPAGVYEVAFRVQIDRREDTVTPLATLAVSVPGYPKVIYKTIVPINFDAAHTAQEFKFRFDNFKAQDVQAGVGLCQNKVPVPKLSVEKIGIAPVTNPCIGTVWPGKILYHTGEDAKGLVVVYNGSGQPWTGTLRCVLESGLNTTRALKEEPLALAAGERREVPVAWNTGKEEYGFALAATLLDSSGKQLDQSKEYFSVADNLWKVGITLSGRGCTVPFGPGPNAGLPVSEVKKNEDLLAAELAKPFAPVYWNYANYIEYFTTTPDNYFEMAPDDKDYWYTGMGDFSMGKRWTQMATEWLHRRGMRATCYVLPGSCGYGGDQVYQKHPDWFVYDKNGQLNVGAYYQKRLEVGSRKRLEVDSTIGGTEIPRNLKLSPYSLWLMPNIAKLETIDAFVDQVVKARTMFGFDGIRFDVAPFLADGYDFYGRKIDNNDPKKRDELEVRAWKRMRDTLWKKLGPDFVIGLNYDHELYYAQHPAVWDEACRQGQLLMEEYCCGAGNPQSPHNRWHDYMTYYRKTGEMVQGLGGHHLIIGLVQQYPVDQLYLHIVTYAVRAHPYAYHYHADDLPLGNYAQFVTRYSALMWDIERVKTLADPDKKIEVQSPGPVWWKELACVRQAPKGERQYIVHLINPPVQEKIYTDPTNKVPPVLGNIQVNIKPDKGEKISRAWLLSAEPTTHAETLPVAVKDGQVSVTVPKLHFWSIVVFE